jgi:hypothetical protein
VSREAVSDVWDALSATGALRPHWRGLPGTDAATHAQVLTHLRSPGLADWSASAARVGFCAHLIRLVGSSATVDRATGEVTSTFSSADTPERVTYVRRGNHRADRCLSCSRSYAADTFHLIRAGVAGGKSLPDTVADNPLVFASLTAPAFGPVHVRPRAAGRCRPRRDTGDRCPHGRLETGARRRPSPPDRARLGSGTGGRGPALRHLDRASPSCLGVQAHAPLVRARARPANPRPTPHRGLPLALTRGRPGHGPGVDGARLDRDDEHLPAPPGDPRRPGRSGPSQHPGVHRGHT